MRIHRKTPAGLAGATALALSLAFAGCRHEDATPITGPSSYAVSGTVEVGIDREGYPAPVSVSSDAGVLATVQADDGGKFSFSGLPPGPVVVRATLARYRPAELHITLPPNHNDVHLHLVEAGP